MAYSQKVVDKFEETLNNPEKASVGRWKPGDEDYHRVGTGIVGAPACGDVMKLQIKCQNIDGENRIVDARFKTYGCGSAIASSGQLIDMLKGKTLEEAQAISNQEIVDILEYSGGNKLSKIFITKKLKNLKIKLFKLIKILIDRK